tara:strand:+ start:44 stop:289 length:246 start_codon:yes stop_codon:yes gene_type:complete
MREKGGKLWCQSPFSFFGLTPEYKSQIHEQIFQIGFNSKGLLSFSELYNMPIYLRKFYMQRLIKHYEDEKKEIEKAKGKKF